MTSGQAVRHHIERVNPLHDVAVHQGRIEPKVTYYLDTEGNPTGGQTLGEGINIIWQNGVQKPNGAILEDVILSCIDRVEFFQTAAEGKFACEENARCIGHLVAALDALHDRTVRRQAEGTEGTYKP